MRWFIGSCVLLSWYRGLIREGNTFGHEVDGLHSLKLTFLLLSALARAVGFRPLTPGVHAEMLPGDQREGGDEENHWQIWSDRETAGEHEWLMFAFCS